MTPDEKRLLELAEEMGEIQLRLWAQELAATDRVLAWRIVRALKGALREVS